MRDLSQLALKKQTNPETAVSLSSSDILFRIREGDMPEIPVDFLETNEVQEYSSTRPSMTGTPKFQANVSCVLRPSATPLTVAPPCALLLEMGLLKQSAVYSIAIGAVSGGPFRNGESISGSISGATGVVFRSCAATPLRYTVTTLTFQSGEVITGATSGAQATTSGTPVAAGHKFQLIDSDFVVGGYQHHASVEFLRGGSYWKGRGVLGEIGLEFKNNFPCIVKSSMLGALEAHGDKALYSLASYPDDGLSSPRFVGAQLAMAGYSPSDIIDFNLAIPLGLELREDAQSSTGVRFSDYERRNAPPTVTFEPAMVTAATYDFFTAYKNGTTFALTWKLGTNFIFYADECQFVNVGVGSRRQLATVPLTIRLCGAKNDELQIWSTA